MKKVFLWAPLMVGLLSACSAFDKSNSGGGSAQGKDALREAIQHSLRDPENVKRDVHRHPYETLKFFEVEPQMTVLEISPGRGWYTEILGPYLKEKGTLYLAIFPQDSDVEYFKNANEALKKKLADNKEAYGKVVFTELHQPDVEKELAPAESVDRVLTFRNVHNWQKPEKVFQAFYKALKPGGILGVVDHRAKPTTKDLKNSGYVKQEDVIRIAEEAGFKFIESSEINANPKDTADHPKGVWTLPPSLRLGEQDKAKYLEIGESDRMTLKFKK